MASVQFNPKIKPFYCEYTTPHTVRSIQLNIFTKALNIFEFTGAHQHTHTYIDESLAPHTVFNKQNPKMLVR